MSLRIVTQFARAARSSVMVAALIALSVPASGCKQRSGSSGPAPDAATAEQGSAIAPTRGPLAITLGDQSLKLTPRDGGYRAELGGTDGKVKVESDRVKVQLGAEAKVKAKDYGFKVYDGSDKELVKGKRNGAGWKLSRVDGAEIGKVDGHGGTLGGAGVTVERDGDVWKVSRGGAVVATASAAMSPVSAALLALTELTPEQRVGVAVFAQDVAR